MKKSILGMVSLITLASVAQNVDVKHDKNVTPVSLENYVSKSSAVAGAESRWLNWADANVKYNFGAWADIGADDFNGWRYTVMPDSLMVQTYSGGTEGRVGYHGAVSIIDPSAVEYDYLDGVNNAMTLDSISVDMIYSRSTDATIVDTMIITVLNHVAATSTWTETATGDTAFISATIPYVTNPNLDLLGTTEASLIHEVIKVPLNVADTALGSIDVAVNKTYSAGQNMGAIVSFKPGFTYVLGDNVDTKNEMSFLAFEEAKSASPTYTASSGNMSYHLTTQTRYQLNGDGFDDIYIPSPVWTAPFSLEHNRIWFKVSSQNVGIEDFEAIGVSVFPNPTNGVVNINSKSENNNVRVFNMLGKEIVSTVIAGNFQLDLSEEKAGIYFVTVKNELGSVTSKIVRN